MAPRTPNIILQFCLCLCIISCNCETDTLKQGHKLKDGEFLVSAGKVFTLGFFGLEEEKTVGYFNPESAQSRFIGIWYTDGPPHKPVWIANRNNPVTRTSGVIEIDRISGDLKISDSNGLTSIMLSSKKQGTVRNVAAVLLDTGNFVLREVNSDGLERSGILWQSFDYPTDTLLPGMKLGFKFKTRKNWSLTSWVSSKVPALGPYTLGLDPNGTNQLILWRRGEIQWKSGAWHEGKFSNLNDYLYSFDFVSNKNERYFVLSAMNTLYINFPMYQIDAFGSINRVDNDQLDRYNRQGSSGPSLSQVVSCISMETRLGCVRQKLLACRGKTWFESTRGYVKTNGIKYEKGKHILGLVDCEMMCLNSCSCVAYAYIYPNLTGCELWNNMTQIIEDGYRGYRDLHLQRDQRITKDTREKKTMWIWLIVAPAIFVAILSLAWLGYRMKRILLIVARFIGLLGYFLQHSIKAYFSRFYDRMQQKIETGDS